ncbi:hypothetical protein CsSME_00031755 [Camellia sinensis var. sinensis]
MFILADYCSQAHLFIRAHQRPCERIFRVSQLAPLGLQVFFLKRHYHRMDHEL